MPTTAPQKKAARRDWHQIDIIAALWKRRLSLRRLSRKHGYSDGSLGVALRRPWPKAERHIADALDTTPQEIWPSRYHADGTPKQGRPYPAEQAA